jgi:Immunoglobulin domain
VQTTLEASPYKRELLLAVEGTPKVVLKPSGPQHVEAGGSLTLECAAEGVPTPHVEFQPPRGVNLQVVEGHGSAVIYISRVTAAHSGIYTCYATTELGRSESTIEVAGNIWSSFSSIKCRNVT